VLTSENGAAIGNQTFRVRGSDATRTNVTFDGVPLNDGESQAVFWANMPDLMSSLQTMQIQRGVGASTNGAAAFGATLNMQAAQPAAKPYGQTSIAYGSFNTFKMNVAAGTGRSKNGWNADMRYSLGQTDGYIDNGFADQYSLFFTGGYSSSRRIVKMNVFHGDQKTGLAYDGVPEADMAKSRRYNPLGLYTDSNGNIVRHNNQTDNYRQTHVHLHYTEQLSDRFRLNTTLYYTRGKGYYEQYRPNERHSVYVPTSQGRSDLIRQKKLDNHLWGAIATATYTTDKTLAHLGVSGNIFDNNHYGNVIKVFRDNSDIPDGYEFSNASVTFFVDKDFDIENEEPVYREEKFGNIYEKYYIPENLDNINGIFVSYTNGDDCWIHYYITQHPHEFINTTFGGTENTEGEILQLPQFDRDILLSTDYKEDEAIFTHRSFIGINAIPAKQIYGFDISPGSDTPKRRASEYGTAWYQIITYYLSRDEIVKMAESIK
jgi:iron complex outermembrane receptor protein